MGKSAVKNYGTTILRIAVGLIFLMHAYLALARSTPAGTAAFLKALGLPSPLLLAWGVILVHGLGGLMLILGVLTRWAAAANALIMLGAFVKIHATQGFFMKVMAGGRVVGGFEYPLLLFAAAVALIFLGSGPLALTRR